MASLSVLIVDYGVGNLFNVARAFRALGAEPIISNDIQKIRTAQRILLPGVGAFAAGMEGLRAHGLVDVLKEIASGGSVPFLGICLGMQLLMDSSEENGEWQGLGILPGRVKRFSPPGSATEHFKVPQIGWNTLETPRTNRMWEKTILHAIPSASSVYFVHSYYVLPQRREDTLAETEYGNERFCSVIQHGAISGCQFHPERSGETGLAILKNFIELNS